MKDNRNVSLVILRVLSMFLVVVSHYIYHGMKTRPELQEYYSLQTLMGGNFITIEALYIFSCIAVNCFVMFHLPIIVYCLASCLFIFIACVVIDIIRSYIFKKAKIDYLVDRLASKLPQL